MRHDPNLFDRHPGGADISLVYGLNGELAQPMYVLALAAERGIRKPWLYRLDYR